MTEQNGTGMFVGVGVADYDDEAWIRLDGALAAVKGLDALLASQGYRTLTVASPTRKELTAEFQRLTGLGQSGFKGPLVLVWSGHGEPFGEALGLILKDTPSQNPGKREEAFQAGNLVSLLREAGSEDSVVIIDSCASGAADRQIFLENLRQLEESTWPDEDPNLAVVVSCKSYEDAEEGVFLGELIDLLENGPGGIDLGSQGLRWSASAKMVWLPDVFYAIKRRARGTETRPRTWAFGASDISFANPCFDPDAGPALVDDRIREVRGEPPRPPLLVETPASLAIAERAGEGSPGLWLLTGGPGAGKSSCLTQIHLELRDGFVPVEASAGIERIAGEIGAAPARAALAIDGFDEAPPREQAQILDLASGWALSRFVVIASRVASASAPEARLTASNVAERAAKVIDLDEASWRGGAIERYVVERLREAAEGDESGDDGAEGRDEG